MARYALFETALGPLGIAWNAVGVTATQLPEASPEETAARLARRAHAQPGQPPADIQRAIDAMTALLEGDEADLSFILCDEAGVAAMDRNVYALTRAIPAGETRTYGDIARRLGDTQLSRRVGQALGRNPFPVIVPCHGVVGADGRLTGFSARGGIDTKLRLLQIERASTGLEDGLFGRLPLAIRPKP